MSIAMGFSLLSHSIRMITGNWSNALRLSSPILLLQILGLVLVGPEYFADTEPNDMQQPVSPLALVFQLLTAIATLWVAVAWNRFILLEEYPSGVVPAFHGDRLLAYLGHSLLIGLAVGIPMFVAIMLAGLFLAAAPGLAVVFVMVIAVAAAWAFYRFSPVLPASAIGKPMKLTEAWAATAPLSNAIFGAMALFVLVAFGLGFAGGLLLLVIPLLGGLALLLLNWFVLLLGISLLTTLYGVAVEGRSI